jgi:hypothetical protein
VLTCAGYEGYDCKKPIRHTKAMRCASCVVHHRRIQKTVQKENAKLRASGRGHAPEQHPELQKQAMGIKEYSRLIDYMKNLPD